MGAQLQGKPSSHSNVVTLLSQCQMDDASLLQGDNTTTFANQWFAAHIAAATTLKKPLILEEMGKAFNASLCNNDVCRTSARVPFYQAAYQAFNTSYYGGGPMQGIMFWRLVNGPNQDTTVQNGQVIGDGLGVTYGDALFTQTIVPNSMAALQYANSKNAANCTPTVILPCPCLLPGCIASTLVVMTHQQMQAHCTLNGPWGRN